MSRQTLSAGNQTAILVLCLFGPASIGPHVADVFYETPEGEGNAMLIAAAPDLLHACELLLIYLGDWDDPEDETCVAARQAIAQAKGG